MAELPPNAFDVFSSEKADHENQLTRALLVLLRLSPEAHAVWLRRVGLADQGLTGLGKPEYAFQTGQMPALDPGAGEIRGISVFITREEPYNRGPIENVDRDQIPDALITYPESERPVLIVVESKVGGERTRSRHEPSH